MPAKHLSSNPDLDEEKADRKLFFAMIGSSPFKAFCGIATAVLLAILAIGWRGYIQGIAIDAPDVKDTKAGLAKLTEIVTVNSGIIKQAEASQKASTEMQARIFQAIQGVSKDVQALEIHVAKVDQKVEDLKAPPK